MLAFGVLITIAWVRPQGAAGGEAPGAGGTVRRALAEAVPRIYSLLAGADGDDLELAHAILEGSAWVWVGGGFAPARRVALSGPLTLAPLLHVLPADLHPFGDLLRRLGVRGQFERVDYLALLRHMAEGRDGEPLGRRQLEVAVWVAQHLTDQAAGPPGPGEVQHP